MNIKELITPVNRATKQGWRGTWARLWVQPSIFSAQKFLIGAAALDSSGLRDFKLLQNTKKFASVYDSNVQSVVDAIIAQTRQVLAEARSDRQPLRADKLPHAVEFEVVGFVSDDSPNHALELALHEAEFPMETAEANATHDRFKPKKFEEIANKIFNAIREKAPLYAEQIIAGDSFGDESYNRRVDFVTRKSSGLIVNGWYANPLRVTTDLLKSIEFIRGYNLSKNKANDPAVFLLRPLPEDGMPADKSVELESQLDEIDHYVKRSGVHVTTHNREQLIAKDVIEWAAID
jgi:hypothetical protein